MMLTEPDIHANAKFWLEVADAIVKFIALLVGAAWALMNYLRGRTYKRKLELGITGKLFRRNGKLYLSILCRLKKRRTGRVSHQAGGFGLPDIRVHGVQAGTRPHLPRIYGPWVDRAGESRSNTL